MCDYNNASASGTTVVQNQEYFHAEEEYHNEYYEEDEAIAREFQIEEYDQDYTEYEGELAAVIPEPQKVEDADGILIVAENFCVLKSLVPDAKSCHLWTIAKECLKQTDSAREYAEDLINTGDYPIEVQNDNFSELADEADDDFKAAMKYYSLRSILPHADSVWTWNTAKEHAKSSGDDFNKFVGRMYETDDYPKMNLSELPPATRVEIKRQEMTKHALEILHNIDASYIEEQLNADTMGYSEEGVSQIIMKCMSNTTVCPSKSEEYYRQITQEAICQFSGPDFDIESFLQRFPEPVKYFENPVNPAGPKYRADVFKYLRAVQPQISIEQIRAVQKRHVYLFRCHRSFFGNSTPIDTIEYQLTDECGRFINELTYIRYYEIIVPTAAIYASLQTNCSRIPELALYNDDEWCCELCEELVAVRKVLTCTEGHIFCEECVKGWVNERLGNGYLFVNCLRQCQGTMPDIVLERVLPEGSLETIIKRRQDQEVGAAQVEGIVNCLWCDYSYVPRAEDEDLICLSPQCGERWCKKCRELAHHPKSCEDTPEEVRKRVYIEERMTNAAVRSCPKCDRKIVKEGGCDWVSCQCGAGVCYNCGQETTHHYCSVARATFDVAGAGQQAKVEADRLFPNVKLNYDPTRRL